MICKHCKEPIQEWYKEGSTGRTVYLHSNGGTGICLIPCANGRFKLSENYATPYDKEGNIIKILKEVDSQPNP